MNDYFSNIQIYQLQEAVPKQCPTILSFFLFIEANNILSITQAQHLRILFDSCHSFKHHFYSVIKSFDF